MKAIVAGTAPFVDWRQRDAIGRPAILWPRNFGLVPWGSPRRPLWPVVRPFFP